MTLLINLLGPRGIHQSSDYRLTDLGTRRPVEDEFGSKQLEYFASTWSAQISFTGFAQIGQRKTRDWILECFRRQPQLVDAMTALSGLASRAAVELRAVPRKDWFLTIVATVRERSRADRLFVVSCTDRPGKPPPNQLLDHFEVSEISMATPRVLIFGSTHTVTKEDRKLLKQLSRGTVDQAEIRRALARINARSAGRSNGQVSNGCLVTSNTPDGGSASENFGRTPGITIDKAGSAEALEMILEAQRGKRPVFVQSKGLTWQGAVNELTLETGNFSKGSTVLVKFAADTAPLFLTDDVGNTFRSVPRPFGAKALDQDAEWSQFEARLKDSAPAGPARSIAFSSTSDAYAFNGPSGAKVGVMEVMGSSGDAIVMKHRVTRITLGIVAAHAFPTFEHPAQTMRTHWDIRSQLTIDGARPHEWSYTFDMLLDAAGGTLSIRQNSAGLRSSSFSSLSCIDDTEELVVVSLICPASMRISKDQPYVSGRIEARLFIRAIPIPNLTKSTR
jgi:hypothetical protein